jgi:hypothetical protein
LSKVREFDNHRLTTYSNLMEWLHKLNMRSAPASQWMATISAAKGVREDEIDKSGLLQFLLEFNAAHKFTKKELLNIAEYRFASCQLTLRTERLTTYRPALQSAAFSSETIPQKVLDTFTDAAIVNCHKLESFNYKLVRLKFIGMFGCGEGWVVFDENWQRFKPYKDYINAVDAIDFLYTVAADRFSEFSSNSPRNHYERYSLLGKNSSYKEWVVCLPDWPETYENTHFYLKNLVLHIRTSEWKDTKDQPLLLIDEIQSDWHALGRDNGYYDLGTLSDEGSNAVPEAPFKKEWHELGIKLAIWIALQSGHRRVAFTNSNVHQSRYGKDLEGFRLLYDQLIPKALAKLAARFDCSLESAKIAVSQPTDTLRYQNGTGWELRKQGKDEDIQIIKNQVVAMRYLESRGQKKSEEVLVFEISPALAESVRNKGVPLFGWW